MTNRPSVSLLDRLHRVSDLWVETCGATRAKLGRLVVNDGGFFTRLGNQPRGTTTETLERFARFFADGANWPDGRVPAAAEVEVAAFCHVNGVSLERAALATITAGKSDGRAVDGAGVPYRHNAITEYDTAVPYPGSMMTREIDR